MIEGEKWGDNSVWQSGGDGFRAEQINTPWSVGVIQGGKCSLGGWLLLLGWNSDCPCKPGDDVPCLWLWAAPSVVKMVFNGNCTIQLSNTWNCSASPRNWATNWYVWNKKGYFPWGELGVSQLGDEAVEYKSCALETEREKKKKNCICISFQRNIQRCFLITAPCVRCPALLSPGVCPTHWISPLWRFTFMSTRYLKSSGGDGHKHLGKKHPAEYQGTVNNAFIVLNSSPFKATSWLGVLRAPGEKKNGKRVWWAKFRRAGECETSQQGKCFFNSSEHVKERSWECFPASSGGHWYPSLFIQKNPVSLWLAGQDKQGLFVIWRWERSTGTSCSCSQQGWIWEGFLLGIDLSDEFITGDDSSSWLKLFVSRKSEAPQINAWEM